ncbi:MAG: creatininase family protein [Nanoarchaeota archaeon]
MRIDEMTSPEVKKLFSKGIALIPIGATEQHGPHLPMGTDTFYAEYITNKIGKELKLPVLPSVSFSVSGYNFPYPTITIEPETITKYLNDICKSLKFHDVDKIFFIVGHGGENCAALETAAYIIARDNDVKIKIFYPWQFLPKELYKKMDDDWHAGFIETSEMLYLKPKLVKKKHIRKSSVPDYMKFIIDYKKTKEDQRQGVFGDPSNANSNIGKNNFKIIIESMIKEIKKLI